MSIGQTINNYFKRRNLFKIIKYIEKEIEDIRETYRFLTTELYGDKDQEKYLLQTIVSKKQQIENILKQIQSI